jgi:G:T-mismatch repair DNA endonuclease (very short patch repair protein)
MIVFTEAHGWDFRRISMSSPRVVLNKESKARTAEEVSEIMRRVHSRDTQPEMVLIRALRNGGFRFKTPNSLLCQIGL